MSPYFFKITALILHPMIELGKEVGISVMHIREFVYRLMVSPTLIAMSLIIYMQTTLANIKSVIS